MESGSPWLMLINYRRLFNIYRTHYTGGSTPIRDFKLEVDSYSYVEITCRLGGFFAFGSTLMEPFLTDANETLGSYLAMDIAHRSPFDALYKDFIVTIIMTKNCGYASLKKRLS